MTNRLHLHRLNWKPDLPDWRDWKQAVTATTPVLPRQIDLRPKCPPVIDQEQIGSCTANALAGALGFLELAELQDGFQSEPQEFEARFIAFSRLFIYYNERDYEGD